MTAAAATSPSADPAPQSQTQGHSQTEAPAGSPDMLGMLKQMKAAQRKSGAPTYDQRIEALEKLEAILHAKKDAIADAVSKDFGNRSRHETLVAEIFIVLSNIKYVKT